MVEADLLGSGLTEVALRIEGDELIAMVVQHFIEVDGRRIDRQRILTPNMSHGRAAGRCRDVEQQGGVGAISSTEDEDRVSRRIGKRHQRGGQAGQHGELAERLPVNEWAELSYPNRVVTR